MSPASIPANLMHLPSAEEWQPERPKVWPGMARTKMRCANPRATELREPSHAEWPLSDAWRQEHRSENSQEGVHRAGCARLANSKAVEAWIIR
jgi:hypothetical protein